jgi:hypothetical protein
MDWQNLEMTIGLMFAGLQIMLGIPTLVHRSYLYRIEARRRSTLERLRGQLDFSSSEADKGLTAKEWNKSYEQTCF